MSDYKKSMPIRLDVPELEEHRTLSIGTTEATITFSQDIYSIEIANHSATAIIYLEKDGTISTVATGLPIYPRQYYAATKHIKQANGISLISDSPNTDVRIKAHYQLSPEELG